MQVDDDIRARLAALDADTVLAGPDRPADDVEIDPIFAKSFGDTLTDLQDWIGRGASIEDLVRRDEIVLETDVCRIHPLRGDDGIDYGVGAFVAPRVGDPVMRGIFHGPTLAVDSAWQDLGIGRTLVAARLLMEGELQTWDHDTPGYSPAGAQCVMSGLEFARDLCARAVTDAEDVPCP